VISLIIDIAKFTNTKIMDSRTAKEINERVVAGETKIFFYPTL